MDSELKKIIQLLQRQNDILGKARYDYLSKEAERKHFEACLIKENFTSKEHPSHVEKVTGAQSTQAWVDFQKDLARKEAEFRFQELKYQILDKEFLAIYGTMKIEAQTISRGGHQT